MKKIITIFLTLIVTTTLCAQRFQAGDLYYQVCTGEGDVVIDQYLYDTIGWNIPAEVITVAEAREICASLDNEEKTTTKYYVMGYVKKLHSKHADGVANYGNAQFYIEDLYGANSSEDFMAYQVYGPNAQKLTDPNCVAVGDFVVIYGELTNYNGTYETVGRGSAYIWKSSNPLLGGSTQPQEPEELVIPEEAKAWNIPAEAIDVMKAREICSGLAAGDSTDKPYYVMGYVKKLHANHASGITGYGNAQFYMENIKGKNSTNDFIAFQVFGLNDTKINNPNAVAVGDFVVVYGKLTNFMGNTYETVGKGNAHIWRSTNPLMVASKPEPKEVTVFEELLNTQAGFEKFTAKSILGDATWNAPAAKNKFANIDAANNEDWLITPALDLTGMSEASLSFKYKFSAAIPADLQGQYTVVVSKDYDGNADNIAKATWVELKGFSYDATSFTESGVISLPADMTGCTCYVAWKYATKDTNHQWAVKEIVVRGLTIGMAENTQMESIADKNLSPTEEYYAYVTYQTIATSNYNSLRSVKIPETVEYEGITYNVIGIGFAAFRYSTLESITIPSSIKIIGEHAFEGCSGLTSIICDATIPPIVGSNAFNSVNNQIPIYVPCGAIPTYKAAIGWNEFPYIVEPYAEYSITINSQNGKMGFAEVEKNTLCGATIFATANIGYRFTQWSDGNTDNPRRLELTQDTILTAEFAQTFVGQCGENLYWSYDEIDQSISITGSGDMYNYTSETQPWLLFQEQIKIVTTSNSTTSIGESAFAGAIRLGHIYLGSNIETIAENAFAECNRLYHIYCYPTYPPFAKQSSFANYNVYLHVPCEYKEGYDLDVVFGNFKYIECLGAETDNTPTDTVIINASSTHVTITWPTEGNADTYTIVIKKGNEVFCTLTFNADGQLLNIAFAPGRNGNHPARYAEQASNGYRFTVTGLEEGTHYTYNIDVKNTANQTINSHTGAFTTQSTTAVENTHSQSPMTNCQKIFRNGQLIILRDGVEYNVIGQEM